MMWGFLIFGESITITKIIGAVIIIVGIYFVVSDNEVNTNEHSWYFSFLVFISSVSQIILKKSANIKYENPIREYLNIRVIKDMAYSIFLLSSFDDFIHT